MLRYVERTIAARFDAIAPCNTLRQVTCPVLLMQGEDDRRVPLADALRIHANRRDSRTELLGLPATGHDSRQAIALHAEPLLAFLRRRAGGVSGSGGHDQPVHPLVLVPHAGKKPTTGFFVMLRPSPVTDFGAAKGVEAIPKAGAFPVT